MLTRIVVLCSGQRTMKENASKPLSLRLSPTVRKTVKKLSDDSGLMQAQLFDLILRAGCAAIEKNGGKFQIPLKFEVKES